MPRSRSCRSACSSCIFLASLLGLYSCSFFLLVTSAERFYCNRTWVFKDSNSTFTDSIVDAASRHIRRISVIGERHSGTTFVKRLLESNLARPETPISDWFCDFKHYFQVQGDRRCPDLNSTLVVVVLRNPYDWVLGMHKQCWCRRNAAEEKLYMQGVSFETFMTRVWANDTYLINAPSAWVRHREASTGRPYCVNVMACRSLKLQMYMDIANWAPNVEFVRYEDVLTPEHSKAWLSDMIMKYKLPRNSSSTAGGLISMTFYKNRPWRFDKDAANML
ncbi:hypothetical protein CEUSTIGMA_g8097.t1 [Chlamydomonas eustigma]|uniref:Sulfotransferase n=1 Tax=Chlamydomonas eustigma TaxID=1157962 RepID=A0A250XCP8_9CHLO|nr:hypothetical protein CEUSTIGMA_g8097.t1 [Chlamydomonas eustigma]|eukprot:GAX80662.1 hypothetical protein CEUSTIGMA_g8097.t1 [Chlamydomonas eustigma]